MSGCADILCEHFHDVDNLESQLLFLQIFHAGRSALLRFTFCFSLFRIAAGCSALARVKSIQAVNYSAWQLELQAILGEKASRIQLAISLWDCIFVGRTNMQPCQGLL